MIIAGVKNDGTGINDENTLYKTDSLWLELYGKLVQKQLNGQIQLRKHDGT
ncbi:MAG: hypothetical protein J7L19_03965 [Dehalococcoidia bacterium]|nr:hypothetical protein [Dehalococcoidia bacterium]